MSYSDCGVRVGHHGNEEIKEYHHVDDRVRAEHHETPESGVTLDATQFKVTQINKSETGPEQRL